MKKQAIYIHQSAISKLMYKGEYRYDEMPQGFNKEPCLRKWKEEIINKNKQEPSEAMLKGSYFEYIAGVNPISDIKEPPLTKTGKRGVSIDRIEEQALAHQKIMYERTGSITALLNNQVIVKCPYDFERNSECPKCHSSDITLKNNFYDTFQFNNAFSCKCNKCGYTNSVDYFAKYILIGTIDTFAPFLNKKSGIRYNGCNIDTKLTQKIGNFGEYQWANPNTKDKIQFAMYDYIFNAITGKNFDKHIWLVFDYSPQLENRIYYTDLDAEDMNNLKNSIKVFIETYKYCLNTDEVITHPTIANCKKCNLNNSCEDAITNEREL